MTGGVDMSDLNEMEFYQARDMAAASITLAQKALDSVSQKRGFDSQNAVDIMTRAFVSKQVTHLRTVFQMVSIDLHRDAENIWRTFGNISTYRRLCDRDRPKLGKVVKVVSKREREAPKPLLMQLEGPYFAKGKSLPTPDRIPYDDLWMSIGTKRLVEDDRSQNS